MRNLISRNIYALNKCPQNTETKMIELKGEWAIQKLELEISIVLSGKLDRKSASL